MLISYGGWGRGSGEVWTHPHMHPKSFYHTLHTGSEHTTLSACILPLPVKSIFPFLHSHSTMKCYRWKTRACSTGHDICEYSERTKFDRHIITTEQSAILQSSRYEDLVNETVQTFGHHALLLRVQCLLELPRECCSHPTNQYNQLAERPQPRLPELCFF